MSLEYDYIIAGGGSVIVILKEYAKKQLTSK